MATTKQAAEVFPPGEFLREELEARGWTQADLAEIIDSSPRLVNEIIVGKRSITPETAKRLGQALGTSAELWLALDSDYRLSQTGAPDDAISRRARLYARGPIAEMIRRGWLERSRDVEALERQVTSFFGIKSIEDDITVRGVAARAKIPAGGVTPAQIAWFCRARQMASAVSAEPFSVAKLDEALARLRGLLDEPTAVRHVPRVLADAGVRFVVLEHTKSSRIDGAAVWMDRRTPLVAVSVRYDRIDSFWHTLMHELGHVRMKHAASLDVCLVGPDSNRSEAPEFERDADRFAVEYLVPQDELEDFINRVHPLYSKKRVLAFAARHKIHPALVLGQLKHRGKLDWRSLARLHAKIREFVTESALCDGWGRQLPL